MIIIAFYVNKYEVLCVTLKPMILLTLAREREREKEGHSVLCEDENALVQCFAKTSNEIPNTEFCVMYI